MAAVIALANHKGGVTKTTSTANIGAMLAERGRRVLLIDADPQANLSELFGVDERMPGERLEDLLENPDAASRIEPPPALDEEIAKRMAWRSQLRLIPASDNLADVVAELPMTVGEGYELRLREIVNALRDRFDFILIDTPPGLGNLSGMALLAADYVLIPAQPADFDVRGAGKVYDLVESELGDANPNLRVLGVLIAPADPRWRIRREAEERMARDEMRVLPVQIPKAIRVAEAPRHGAPTAVLEPDSRVSTAYRKLAAHIEEQAA
jgi:chromosome partitioning protein